MTKIYLPIILLLFIGFGCKTTQQEILNKVFQPKLVSIAVQDIDTSIEWYRQKLGFEIERDLKEYPDYGLKLAFLKLDDFHLELIEFANAYKASNFLPNADSYMGGVFKIGLVVNDIQGYYDHLKEMEGVEMVAGLGELPDNPIPIKWPSQYFLIADPDGNYIQFFDTGAKKVPSPWLFMITVDNLENAISWYTKNLGFKHHQTVGEVGNKRAILASNNYVLELFEPTNVLKTNEIPAGTTILGFKKIAFGVTKLTSWASMLDRNGVEVAMPLEASDFDWATRAMIVKDAEGNWTQLFELTTVQK